MISNIFGSIMSTVFFPILLTIDAYLYKFFSYLYGIYLQLANMRILTNDLYDEISGRIYIVVGIVSLFIIAYSLLQNVINPDDKKINNGVGVLKRVIIAFLVIILVPVGFDFLYNFQNAILSGNVIGTLIVGTEDLDATLGAYGVIQYYDDEGNAYYQCSSSNECDDYTTDGSCTFIATSLIDEDDVLNDDLSVCATGSLVTVENEMDYEITVQQLYGNAMGVTVLQGFMSVSDDHDATEVIPTFDGYDVISITTSTAAKHAIFWCKLGLGAAGLMLITGVGTVVVGALSLTAGSVIGYSCLVGTVEGTIYGLTFGIAEYQVLMEENYNWAQVLYNISYDGNFEQIVPFSSLIGESIDYMPIISTIAICFLIYMMFSFIIDLGIRVVKLAFYQLIVPIPAFMSILPNNEKLLSNWFKLTLTTYMEVFIRVLCMMMVVFFFKNLDEIEILDSTLFIRAIIIMGLVAFARQAPKLLSEVTGIKSEGMKLGIREKLGEGGVFAAGALGYSGIKGSINNFNDHAKGTKMSTRIKSGIAGGTSSLFNSGRNGALKAKSFTDGMNAAKKGNEISSKNKDKRQMKKIAYKSQGLDGVTGRLKDFGDAAKTWAGIGLSTEALEARIASRDELNSNLKKGKDIAKDLSNKVEVQQDEEIYLAAEQEYFNTKLKIETGKQLDEYIEKMTKDGKTISEEDKEKKLKELQNEYLKKTSIASKAKTAAEDAVAELKKNAQTNGASLTQEQINFCYTDTQRKYMENNYEKFNTAAELNSYSQLLNREGYKKGQTYRHVNGETIKIESEDQYYKYYTQFQEDLGLMMNKGMESAVDNRLIAATKAANKVAATAKKEGKTREEIELARESARNEVLGKTLSNIKFAGDISSHENTYKDADSVIKNSYSLYGLDENKLGKELEVKDMRDINDKSQGTKGYEQREVTERKRIEKLKNTTTNK